MTFEQNLPVETQEGFFFFLFWRGVRGVRQAADVAQAHTVRRRLVRAGGGGAERTAHFVFSLSE